MEITYLKQKEKVDLGLKSVKVLGEKWFTLGLINGFLSYKPPLSVCQTCDDYSGGEISKNYHLQSAKKVFNHFNTTLLEKVIEEKQLRGLL